MARFETWLHSDLQQIPEVVPLKGNLFSADQQGNRVGVIVTNNQQPVQLTGSVNGYVIRSDGRTVIHNGAMQDNRAWFDLSASCYVAVGPIQIIVKVGNTTVGACSAYVFRSSTDTYVDPGKEIPTVAELLAQIGTMRTATAEANNAAASAVSAAANANARAIEASHVNVEMTKDGKLITIQTTNRNNVSVTKTTQEPTLKVTKSGNATTLRAEDADGITTQTLYDAPIDDSATSSSSFWSSQKVVSELNQKLSNSLKGAANGLAELDAEGKVPASQLPSYVDDVLEYDFKSQFPATGETGKIYVEKVTNLTYRWTGSQYIEISKSLALGETESTAFSGYKGKQAWDHATRRGGAFAAGLYVITTNSEGHVTNARAATKADIGLGNVDNTADINKPSSAATRQSEQRALASAETAMNSQYNAEAWAVGTRDGTDVPSTDETYQNNSKYYADLANSNGDLWLGRTINYANQAKDYRDEIAGMSATATTLAPGSQATAVYTNGVLQLGIPAGQPGGEYIEEEIEAINDRLDSFVSYDSVSESIVITTGTQTTGG